MAEGLLGAQQQQYRYGGEMQQEETIRHAASSVPLKVSHVVDHLSQNLSDRKLLDSDGIEPPPNVPHDSFNERNAADILAQRTKLGLSPLEMQLWHQRPELQIS